MASRCSTIKDALVTLFATELEVSARGERCVVTLPLKTLDDRFIEVIIEAAEGSFTYVHDGGKNISELFAQGIHVTDRQADILERVAKSYGAHFYQGRFQVLCSNDSEINDAVLAIGQCSSLAMIEVVSHEAEIEEEPISSRVWRALNAWQPPFVEIQRRYPVKGLRSDHTFDFVSLSVKPSTNNVAVKILAPSFGPLAQSRLYGYMAYDIAETPAGRWPRIAVVTKADEWSHQALETVRKFSTEVIQLPNDRDQLIETALPQKMDQLTKVA